MTQTALPLRPVEFYVLLALCRGETHGYGIIRETERQSNGEVRLDPGTLYRAIARLRAEDLVREVAGADDDDPDARRRRVYAITGQGRGVAAAEARRLAGLTRAAAEVDLLDETESV